MFTAKPYVKVLVKEKNQRRKKGKNKEALDTDPYAVTSMLKRKNKLIPDIVGHIPREISLFI